MKWFDDRPRLKNRLKPLVRAVRAVYGAFVVWMGRPMPRRMGPLLLGAAAAAGLRRAGWPVARPDDARVWAAVLLAAWAVSRLLWENFLKVRPLNIIVRYFAILDLLKPLEPFFRPHPRILEAGSGSEGLGHLVSYPFWGCDVHFAGPINPNMKALRVSTTELPFEDGSFDVVISLDCLEHIPTDALRRKALEDMWRVAKSALIIGFPAGKAAHAVDRALSMYYRRKGMRAPDWLREHMANGLPAEDFLESVWAGERPRPAVLHEPRRFHLWMMKREANPLWCYGFMAVIFWTRWLLRPLLRRLMTTGEPYRRLYVLAKEAPVREAVRRAV
jgi:hypothetical protein